VAESGGFTWISACGIRIAPTRPTQLTSGWSRIVEAAARGLKPSVIWLHFQECTGCTESLFDPCLACAIHTFDPAGREIMKVRAL